jgi:hypothetical protein
MKTMTLTAIALMLGLVLSPLAECGRANVVFNHDFEQVCRQQVDTLFLRDRGPRGNNVNFNPSFFSGSFVPSRPGYGKAISIDDPLQENRGWLHCQRVSTDYTGCGRFLGLQRMTFMAHVNPRGEAGIVESTGGFWMTIDSAGFARAGIGFWTRQRPYRYRPLVVRSTFSIPFNQWAHLAMSFAGRRLTLYVNGQIAATRVASPRVRSNLFIGHSFEMGYTRKRNANGLLDDARLFDVPLTHTQIQRQMVALPTKPKACPEGTTPEPVPVTPIESLPPPDPDTDIEVAPVPPVLSPAPTEPPAPVPSEPVPGEGEPAPGQPLSPAPTEPGSTEPAPSEGEPATHGSGGTGAGAAYPRGARRLGA